MTYIADRNQLDTVRDYVYTAATYAQVNRVINRPARRDLVAHTYERRRMSHDSSQHVGQRFIVDNV